MPESQQGLKFLSLPLVQEKGHAQREDESPELGSLHCFKTTKKMVNTNLSVQHREGQAE